MVVEVGEHMRTGESGSKVGTFRDLEMLVSKWNLSSNPKIIDFLPNCIPYMV